MPKFICFGHRSHVGKDTLADYVVSILRSKGKRATKISFASPIKHICHEMYGWDGLQDEAFYNLTENRHLRDVPLPHVGKTPVELWIEHGQHGRSIYEDIWIDMMLANPRVISAEYVAVPDLRFGNEFNRMWQLEAYLEKVTRKGVSLRDTIPDNEGELFDWPNVWANDSNDLDQIRIHAKEIIASL